MGTVYVVHCVDTEGPLYESLEATFERIYALTSIRLDPTLENLEKIQKGLIELNGYEEMAKVAFSERLLNYNATWDQLDKMLKRITSSKFRKSFADSNGAGWKYSWFIIDWPNYRINPRSKDIGYNNIYNHYSEFYRINKLSGEDGFEWHAHPMSFYQEAHRCGVSYINSPHIFESLCHRIIDCGDFPRCYRPGFHTERPDSHWFLEQFIPYDYSNQAITLTDVDNDQNDMACGVAGDWRRAVSDWSYYHPAHDDYQIEGNCNRVIFRCLNVGTRIRLLTQDEVLKAFFKANQGEDVVLAFCDHDFRNMEQDIREVYTYIQYASRQFPLVKWNNSTAYEAANTILKRNRKEFKLSVDLEGLNSNRPRLVVEANYRSFGSQPFLAIRTVGGVYSWQMFDFEQPYRKWTYTFGKDSIPYEDICEIGVASNACDASGMLVVVDKYGKTKRKKQW